MNSILEIEAKIFVDKKLFYDLYQKLGSPLFVEQKNVFYNINGSDTNTIRIRYEEDVIFLTKKSFVASQSKYKIKQEDQIMLDFFSEDMLFFLGYEKTFSYQKKRASISFLNCVISFDVLSIGTYIEIEGEEHNIAAVISELSLDNQPLETKSYVELLQQNDTIQLI